MWTLHALHVILERQHWDDVSYNYSVSGRLFGRIRIAIRPWIAANYTMLLQSTPADTELITGFRKLVWIVEYQEAGQFDVTILGKFAAANMLEESRDNLTENIHGARIDTASEVLDKARKKKKLWVTNDTNQPFCSFRTVFVRPVKMCLVPKRSKIGLWCVF